MLSPQGEISAVVIDPLEALSALRFTQHGIDEVNDAAGCTDIGNNDSTVVDVEHVTLSDGAVDFDFRVADDRQ